MTQINWIQLQFLEDRNQLLRLAENKHFNNIAQVIL